MATNPYFNNVPNYITNEMLLVENLVIEAMQIKGMDVFYMPRTSRDEVDYLFGEDPLKQYTSAYPIEMYLENVTGMGGEGDFISKFGLEIREETSFLVSRKRFKLSVGIDRPREGDLVYIPMLQDFFEITFVEHENDQAMFHTLGRGRDGNVYVYALKLQQFKFSNEVIQTGITEIDSSIRGHYARTHINIDSVTGKFLNDEILWQGDDWENRTAEALVYDFHPNTSIEVYRTQGTFITGNVYGNTTNTIAYANTPSEYTSMDNAFYDLIDNGRIEEESDNIIDWSVDNPFGNP